MKTNLYIKILILAFFLMGTINAFSQFKVIVNNSNSLSSINKKEASDCFLKKKTKWADGTTVTPVDLSSGSKVRDAFSQKVHGKTTAAIRSYWQQAAFSGTASAPPEKSNDAEVIEFVRKNPGAIGYVSESANTTGVKTLSLN